MHCDLRSNMTKVKALAAAGGVEGIPADILSAQGGEVFALKVVGAFIGSNTTAGVQMRKAMLMDTMKERLAVLDEIDAMLDTESETDVKQLQYQAVRRSINKIPIYWEQCMPPSITAEAMAAVDLRINRTLSLLATAADSSQEQRDDWGELMSLPTSMGGLEVGGHARGCTACYVGMVLNSWLELERTSSVLRGVAITDAGFPMLTECCSAYEYLRTLRGEVESTHEKFKDYTYYTVRGGKREGKFHPSRLPRAKSLPSIAEAFDPKSKLHPPAQRQLCLVGQHWQWLERLAAAERADETRPHPKYGHRHQAHFIAISQPGAGGGFDVVPDGSYSTTIVSPEFEVMLQRHGSLGIAAATAAHDALASAGEVVDRLGDGLQSGGEYNRRHNAVLRAVRDMVAAGATGQLVLGDKGDPDKTADLNATHAVDLAELGANEATGGDVLYEVKCASPTKASQSAGNGSTGHGGAPASVGHLLGHGNTEEHLRLQILGCQERGRKSQGPLVHSTGHGWVKQADGQYKDALVRTRAAVVPMIIETTGALAPHSRRHCGYLHGRSKGKGAADRTRYGRTRISTKSFFVHHTQQMAKAAVMYDARAILKRVTVLKQQRLRTGTAAHAALASEWA